MAFKVLFQHAVDDIALLFMDWIFVSFHCNNNLNLQRFMR